MKKTNSKKRSTSSPMEAQKQINQDFVNLAVDYKTLVIALWRKPLTKYIFGGISLAMIAPALRRNFTSVAGIGGFVSDRVEDIKDRLNISHMESEDTSDVAH